MGGDEGGRGSTQEVFYNKVQELNGLRPLPEDKKTGSESFELRSRL